MELNQYGHKPRVSDKYILELGKSINKIEIALLGDLNGNPTGLVAKVDALEKDFCKHENNHKHFLVAILSGLGVLATLIVAYIKF